MPAPRTIRIHQYQAMPAILITGLCLTIEVPLDANELLAIVIVPFGETAPPSSYVDEPSKLSCV